MEAAEQNVNKTKVLEKRGSAATAQIREVVRKVELKTKDATPGKQVRKVLRVLKKKDKEEIVQAVLEKYYNSEELKPFTKFLSLSVIDEGISSFNRYWQKNSGERSRSLCGLKSYWVPMDAM